MKDRELLQMAFEALDVYHFAVLSGKVDAELLEEVTDAERLIELLRDRLMQHKELDEAIAAGDGTLHGAIDYWQGKAQREWRGLTTAERKALWNATNKATEFAELIEAKLKERNA